MASTAYKDSEHIEIHTSTEFFTQQPRLSLQRIGLEETEPRTVVTRKIETALYHCSQYGNGVKSHFRVAFSGGFGFTFSRRTSCYQFSVRFGTKKKLYCEDYSQYDPCVVGYRYKRRLVHYTESDGSTLPLNVDTYVPLLHGFIFQKNTIIISAMRILAQRLYHYDLQIIPGAAFFRCEFSYVRRKIGICVWNFPFTKQAVSSFVTKNHLAFCRISTRYGKWPLPLRCIYVSIVFGIDFLDWITRGTSEEMACES